VLTSLLAVPSVHASPLGAFFDQGIGDLPVRFFHGGWGKVSAAATTQYVIDQFHPELLINLGTCGGFEGRIERGTIILVERTIIYDIVEQMTDGAEAIDHYATELDLRWLPRVMPSPVSRGLLVSGDRDIVVEDIPHLLKEYNAVAADWESGAIAWVAERNRQRLLILRGVSDLVGGGGGEAYGDYALFLSRTREVLKHLLDVLPDWLLAIDLQR
jgi:adenosylhomocysteine nucleosidase